MDTFASKVGETIQQLGQAFLIAYYFPAVFFVLVQLYVFVPVWTALFPQSNLPSVQIPTSLTPDLGSLLLVLLIALAVAVLLVGLNDQLISDLRGTTRLAAQFPAVSADSLPSQAFQCGFFLAANHAERILAGLCRTV